MHFKRADVNPAASYPIKTWTTLIVVRRTTKFGSPVLIAGLPGNKRVCECRATVVLQRTEHRIGVDLIARAI